MTTLECNRCYACGKLFCCAECCTDHIRKKHPGRESECPLCRSERLLVKDFANQRFLCHVVFNHLPLRCRLCGDSFKSCADLRALGACSRRRLSRAASAIHEEASRSRLSPETPSPLDKTPSGPAGAKRKEFSIEGDCNGNFGSFTSPPELSRNTSTPMHVNLASAANFAFKTPRSPIYTFKTPKAASLAAKSIRRNERSGTKENNSVQSEAASPLAADSPTSDSIYFSLSSLSRTASADDRTPLRSILLSQPAIGDNSQREQSRSVERKIAPMQDINEEMGVEIIEPEDMDLTDVMCNVVADDASDNANGQRPAREQRDSVKRVRFSDQFEVKSEEEVSSRGDGGGFNASESEEFFEARQSISEMSVAIVDKLSTSAAMIKRENEQNLEREESGLADSKSPEIAPAISARSSTAASTSRVVMMVVVEQNGGVSATELAPLIDSSLKKLESAASSGQSPRENSTAASPRGERPSGGSVVSRESYMSVSTIECYSTPSSSVNEPRSPRDSPESSNPGAGGIFSAVAHAMRAAFRNLSGANSSKSISRELVSQRENPALLSSNPDSSTTSSSVLTNLASALVPRPAKRSRDTDEVPVPQSSESVDPQNDVRSPVPKRPRGWYKIRAREPIARMRNNSVTSPRGVSSETQCFQQGSLSIGDTILPIPSRAHQATQTD